MRAQTVAVEKIRTMMQRPLCRALRLAAAFCFCIVLCLVTTLSTLVAGEWGFVTAVFAADARYVGSRSFRPYVCHGSVQPRHETIVLQNEYSTWILSDKHAQAWNVLNNRNSQRIAKILGTTNLGAADAAHSPRCL